MKLHTGLRSIFSTFIFIGLVLGMQACGGGGGGGGLAAPAIANASAQSYVENSAITTLRFSNSGGGSLTSCSADTLPAGLSVAVSGDSTSCEITGTPTAVQATTVHTITATNTTASDTATVSLTITALPNQDGSGIYNGTATVDVNTDITDLRGIIYNNRFMFFSVTANPHVLYDGTITSITSDDYTATVDVYENGVKTQTAVAVTGKVLTATSITGTIGTSGTAGNHNGTFSLTFDSVYNRAGTTARIEATGFNKTTGTTYGTLNPISDRYDFRTDFSFGVASTTCDIINEVYAIPDTAINIYTIDNIDIVDLTGISDLCLDSYEGSGYSGLITVVDDGISGTDNRILIAYTNGTNSVFGLLTKP